MPYGDLRRNFTSLCHTDIPSRRNRKGDQKSLASLRNTVKNSILFIVIFIVHNIFFFTASLKNSDYDGRARKVQFDSMFAQHLVKLSSLSMRVMFRNLSLSQSQSWVLQVVCFMDYKLYSSENTCC